MQISYPLILSIDDVHVRFDVMHVHISFSL